MVAAQQMLENKWVQISNGANLHFWEFIFHFLAVSVECTSLGCKGTSSLYWLWWRRYPGMVVPVSLAHVASLHHQVQLQLFKCPAPLLSSPGSSAFTSTMGFTSSDEASRHIKSVTFARTSTKILERTPTPLVGHLPVTL